jgi:hypothetical protein
VASNRHVDFEVDGGGEDLAPALERTLDRSAGVVVVTCASLHSPWEVRTGSTSWTDLLKAAGFGLTLPLQTRIAAEVSRVCAGRDNPPVLINAAYPDVVNPVLVGQGLPVTAGAGNVAALEVYLRRAVDVDEPGRMRILGHHLHLAAVDDPADEVLAWVDDVPLEDVSQSLETVRATARGEVNAVSALQCAKLVTSILTGKPYIGHLPGPLGLPGGYPVMVTGRSVAVRLPDDATASAAVWNRRISAVEGVCVNSAGQIEFSQHVVDAVRPYWTGFPALLPADEIGGLTEELLLLRAALRNRPAGRLAGDRRVDWREDPG